MVGWHHQFNGHEFEQTSGESEGQGSLVCCIHGVGKSFLFSRITLEFLLFMETFMHINIFKEL